MSHYCDSARRAPRQIIWTDRIGCRDGLFYVLRRSIRTCPVSMMQRVTFRPLAPGCGSRMSRATSRPIRSPEGRDGRQGRNARGAEVEIAEADHRDVAAGRRSPRRWHSKRTPRAIRSFEQAMPSSSGNCRSARFSSSDAGLDRRGAGMIDDLARQNLSHASRLRKPARALRGAMILLHARAEKARARRFFDRRCRAADAPTCGCEKPTAMSIGRAPSSHISTTGHAARLQELAGLGAVRQAGQHDGSGGPGQGRANQGLFLILAIFAVAEEDLQPFRSQFRLEGRDGLGEEGVADRGHDDADDLARMLPPSPPATRFGT